MATSLLQVRLLFSPLGQPGLLLTGDHLAGLSVILVLDKAVFFVHDGP